MHIRGASPSWSLDYTRNGTRRAGSCRSTSSACRCPLVEDAESALPRARRYKLPKSLRSEFLWIFPTFPAEVEDSLPLPKRMLVVRQPGRSTRRQWGPTRSTICDRRGRTTNKCPVFCSIDEVAEAKHRTVVPVRFTTKIRLDS